MDPACSNSQVFHNSRVVTTDSAEWSVCTFSGWYQTLVKGLTVHCLGKAVQLPLSLSLGLFHVPE